MNPFLARVIGESDVVPVLANVPRGSRRRPGAAKPVEPEDEAVDDSISRMVRESSQEEASPSDEESLIPPEAKPVDGTATVGKPLRPLKAVVQEPSHPTAAKEKFLTPYAALTAPDVTPQALTPIDPSQVPGAAKPEQFTVADLSRTPETTEAHPDAAAQAMRVLLGHQPAAKPPANTAEAANAGAVRTAEALAAKITAEAVASAPPSVLVAASEGGAPMPAHVTGDGSAILSTFRRFSG